MSPEIKSLPEDLINKISAGEILDRPSSAVKELIENSLDAKSTKIEIDLENGGLSLFKVKDNGQGILKTQLIKALKKFTTSKIYSLDDLQNISSLGFRGEALASIGAVSNLKVISRSASEPNGWLVINNGGEISKELKPHNHQFGTSVIVTNIFFNTPARRKFLKSPNTEYSKIYNEILRSSIVNNKVEFILKNNNNIRLHLKPKTDLDRFKEVLNLKSSIKVVEEKIESIELKLFLHLPNDVVSKTNANQYIYVNRRPVKDKIVAHAIKSSLSDLTHTYLIPSYAVFLKVNNNFFDSNVHPKKEEVRFQNNNLIYSLIAKTTKKLFDQKSNLKVYPEKFIKKTINNSFDFKFSSELPFSQQRENKHLSDDFKLPNLGIGLGMIKDTFIVSENEEGLVLVDLHAAHERIIFEEMKSKLNKATQKVDRLLIPIKKNISDSEREILISQKDSLLDKGLDFYIKDKILTITQIPLFLKIKDFEIMFSSLIEEIDKIGDSPILDNTQLKIMGNMACKMAFKANTKLNINEINNILKKMETTPKFEYCNHGRPTHRIISFKELDSFFIRGH